PLHDLGSVEAPDVAHDSERRLGGIPSEEILDLLLVAVVADAPLGHLVQPEKKPANDDQIEKDAVGLRDDVLPEVEGLVDVERHRDRDVETCGQYDDLTR